MKGIKSISLKCESCGANLTTKEGRDFMFCEHCGAKIYLNAKQEIKHINVDETEIKKALCDAEVEKKKLELEAQEKERKIKLIGTIIIGIIMLMIIGSLVNPNADSEAKVGGFIALLFGSPVIIIALSILLGT